MPLTPLVGGVVMWLQNTVGFYYIDSCLGKVWHMWPDGHVTPTGYSSEAIIDSCDQVDTPEWGEDCLCALEHYLGLQALPFTDFSMEVK
jgi:hypothetical protein